MIDIPVLCTINMTASNILTIPQVGTQINVILFSEISLVPSHRNGYIFEKGFPSDNRKVSEKNEIN